MPTLIPAGPYKHLTTVEGVDFPYYVIPFDEDGVCAGPQTLKHLLDHSAGYSDIFVFSHGWNNDWTAATKRYDDFIRGFQEMRKSLKLQVPSTFRPLLVGIFWPSQALEWFESETGPQMASDVPAPAASTERDWGVLQDIGTHISVAQRARFFSLAQQQTLSADEAKELAEMLASISDGGEDDISTKADQQAGDQPPALAAPTAMDLLSAAAEITASSPTAEPDYDTVGVQQGGSVAPQAAISLGGLFSALDPRNILKPFTVWQMKDRAGKVGRNGVRELLRGLLSRTQSRVHLLGHSYGCKVVMTALASVPSGTRAVQSAVLFQPAISQYAFATDIKTMQNMRGGLQHTLGRVTAPVICTFSDNDWPLTKLFHLALRREGDLGEDPKAAGLAPSKYCALGGYGPQGTASDNVTIHDEGQPYTLPKGGTLLAVNGTGRIGGHGDISNQATWWLAYTAATSA
ncbi:hypothetical protein ACG02S_26015 [Roseateles sp. DC23W]|uniref:Alpha/beta hydrolase n=1 Tax=Pelomonas dachongensis TaxID=3299029 RepID=A0ABW7EV88_9BURK